MESLEVTSCTELSLYTRTICEVYSLSAVLLPDPVGVSVVPWYGSVDLWLPQYRLAPGVIMDVCVWATNQFRVVLVGVILGVCGV